MPILEMIGGNRLRFAIWHETVMGSETPTAAFELPVSWDGLKLGEMIKTEDSSEARGGRGEAVPFDVEFDATGQTFKLIGKYESIWHVWKHIAGTTIPPTGSDPYDHEATLGGLSSFGCEAALVDPTTASSSILYRAFGCRISKVGFPIARKGGEFSLDVTFDAVKVTKSTGTPITATAYDTEKPIVFGDQTTCTINSADAADITEGSLSIELGLESVVGARSGGRVSMVGSHLTKVRGSLKGMMHSASAYDALASGRTMFPIVITFTSGTDVFGLELPYCRMDPGPLNVSGPQGVALDRDFGAFEDPTDSDSPLKVTGTNGVASY